VAWWRFAGFGSVLSGKARYLLAWRGRVLRGRARHGEVWHGRVRRDLSWRGSVLYSIVRSCPVRHSDVRRGLIKVLRGLALYSTVQSCPVRRSKVRLHMAVRGPVRLGQVEFGRVRHYRGIVRSCCAARGTAERGFVWQGKVLSWFGEVLIGVVGFSGERHCVVRYSFIEALHGVAKFGPAKHSVAGLGITRRGDALRGIDWAGKVMLAEALFWQGGAGQREVRNGAVWHSMVSIRHGTEGSGFARLCAAGQALVRRHLGLVWPGEAGRCMARLALVSSRFGRVLLSQVRRGPVLQGKVGYALSLVRG